jgi:hypothetical protein
MMFVIDNQTKFCSGLDVYGCNTWNQKQLYVPNANLSAIKLFNRLPKTIQSFKEDRISFKMNLFLYLMNNSFYTVPEFVEYNVNNYF